ncbi:MAG TPA: hypothetical protein VL096_12945, partial [Pirellulaceae bacterium]|nr:hypothetical protein [Pirellulaceae bacterium]
MPKTVVLGIVLSLVPTLALAQGEAKFKPVVLPDSIRFVQAFSPDHQAGTMLFDNYVLATELGKGTMPDAKVKSFTYCLQPEVTKEMAVKHVVRGYASTQGKASAAMIVHAGGQTHLVDLKAPSRTAKNVKAADSPHHKLATAQARD